MIDLLFNDVEEQTSWNKLVTESIKLQVSKIQFFTLFFFLFLFCCIDNKIYFKQNIDENTNIVYQATPPFGGGLITARDFVILTHRKKCGNYCICSGVSVSTAAVQVRPNMTR